MSALQVAGLSKRFGERVAVSDVSIDVGEGEMVAVVGRNGAGKTTLLSIVAGVQRASEGSVSRLPGEVGWVPQQPAVYGKLSVAENLRLFARLEGVADVEGTVRRMLAQTGLSGRADERVQRLSGGNRQRVNVALGLLADPPVIVLDEPSTALDPTQRRRLWQFISKIAEGGTAILFSTHIVDEAARYASLVLVLDEGEQLFFGPPSELIAAAKARDAGAVAGAGPAAGTGLDAGAVAGAGSAAGTGPHAGAGADFESALVAFLAAAGRDRA